MTFKVTKLFEIRKRTDLDRLVEEYSDSDHWPGGRLQKSSVILAEGEIKSDSVEQFQRFLQQNPIATGTRVYLNSPGGDLEAGLKFGHFFRDNGFNTGIGTYYFTNDNLNVYAPGAGVCASSCTFAFLGGVDRLAHKDDLFGVHRFHSEGDDIGMDAVQKNIGVLLQYVRVMGVDQRFIEDMTVASPERINPLTFDRLIELHVITSSEPLPGAKLPGDINTNCTED
jgi:hypothetical protein